MKSLITTAVGTASALASGVSLAQNGNMMNGSGGWGGGWMGDGGWMGGYGGFWGPVLLVVVVGIVVWAVLQKRK